MTTLIHPYTQSSLGRWVGAGGWHPHWSGARMGDEWAQCPQHGEEGARRGNRRWALGHCAFTRPTTEGAAARACVSGCSFWNEEGVVFTWCSVAGELEGLLCGKYEGHDETIEAKHLSEDENQDHAHKQPGLLGSAPNTGVPHNANGKASCQAAQAHTQACTQLEETPGGEKR